MNKKVYSVLMYLVSIAFIVVLFYKVDIDPLVNILHSVNVVYITIACVIALVFRLLIYPFVWHEILVKAGVHIKYAHVFMVNTSVLPLKLLLPFKMMEIARAGGLLVFSNVEFPVAASSLVFLKLVSFAGSLMLAALSGMLQKKLWFLAALLLAFLIYSVSFGFLRNLHSILIKKMPRYKEKINQAFICFNSISFVRKIQLSIYAVIFLLGELITIYFVFHSLGSNISVYAILCYIPVISLISSLPVSVHGIGLRETLIVTSLTVYGSKELLLAAGLLMSSVYFILPALIGAIILALYSGKRIFIRSTVEQ